MLLLSNKLFLFAIIASFLIKGPSSKIENMITIIVRGVIVFVLIYWEKSFIFIITAVIMDIERVMISSSNLIILIFPTNFNIFSS